MIRRFDMTGINDNRRKDEMPKLWIPCSMCSWLYDEKSYDCHQVIDGALPKE